LICPDGAIRKSPGRPNEPPEFDAEGVAQILATYVQGLFRTVLLSYDRPQLERQVDLFLTSLGL